jgi:tetratricopeptide (TPR) repeat protein
MRVTRKALELDVVELTEDLPEYGVKRGERGTVVTTFDSPDEAYDLEFVDEQGQSKFAYSVAPNQISTGDEIAKRTFESGLDVLNAGNIVQAEQLLRESITLRPHYIAALHNAILDGLGRKRSWLALIEALRLVIRLNPDYHENSYRLAEYLRDNLATAYNNQGVQFADQEDSNKAILWFDLALAVGPRSDVVALVRRNLVKRYTAMGIRASQQGDHGLALLHMLKACEIDSSEQQRHNVGVALVNLSSKHLQEGELELAREALQKAVDSFNSNPEIQKHFRSSLSGPGLSIPRFDPSLEFIPASQLQERELSVAA